jgi:hypothetical protein
MMYRGQIYLAVVWFGSTFPPHPSPSSKLDRRRKREGGRGWAWSRIIRQRESRPSLNHSMLSAWIKAMWGQNNLSNCFLNTCLYVHSPLLSTYKVRTCTLYKICNHFFNVFYGWESIRLDVHINIYTVLENTKFAGVFSKNKNHYNCYCIVCR